MLWLWLQALDALAVDGFGASSAITVPTHRLSNLMMIMSALT
jgi:hypothetical protein